MGRNASENRLNTFRALEPNTLYTAAGVASLAAFPGDEAEIRLARSRFRGTLNSHYVPMLGEPDDHLTTPGQGRSLYPAWLGKKWKEAAQV